MPKSILPSIAQVSLSEMERGLAQPVARLKAEPEEISNRLGVFFESARDELDDLKAAVIQLDSGRQFALVRHRRQPNPGTDILISERSHDFGADLRDALRILHLEPEALTWIHPDIDLRMISA